MHECFSYPPHLRCPVCQAAVEQARWRMNNNTLTWAAGDARITDQQWSEYVDRYEVDDLHRLLEETS